MKENWGLLFRRRNLLSRKESALLFLF